MKQKFAIAVSLAVILAMLLTSLALADSDTTPPVITYYFNGTWGDSWIVMAGDLIWQVVDDESPISSTSGCDTTYIWQSTPGVTFTCSATSEGGTSTESLTVRVDTGRPTINASRSPEPNQYGWNNTDVTVHFTCEDDMSGVMYCEPDWIFTDDGADQGGGRARVVDFVWWDDYMYIPWDINIDKTPPTVSLVGGPADGASYYFGSVPAEPTCSASDALSGLDGSCSVSGYSAAVGTHTVSASATDKASNSASASATYTVLGLSDTTAPVITPIIYGAMSDSGWYVSVVQLSWWVVDDESPISSSSGCDFALLGQDTPSITVTCTATSEGGTSSESVTFMIDQTPPDIYGYASPPPNAYGWNNTDVTVTFICSDAMSGMMYCEPDWTFREDGFNQGVQGRAVDHAWNDWRYYVYSINIDKTPPTVSLVGGPANGGTYYFGFVPAAPTCSASDALSGLDGSCSVSGYSTAVGSHTVTASAKDKASNSASASATYTVLPWTLTGFYAPVEMNGVYNVVRSGNRVALKFEVFAGPKELSDTSVVQSFTPALVACPPGSGEVIEGGASASGDTALHYDTTAGRFILNWQTPRQAGACCRVTMMTQDGSSLVAFFRLR